MTKKKRFSNKDRYLVWCDICCHVSKPLQILGESESFSMALNHLKKCEGPVKVTPFINGKRQKEILFERDK